MVSLYIVTDNFHEKAIQTQGEEFFQKCDGESTSFISESRFISISRAPTDIFIMDGVKLTQGQEANLLAYELQHFPNTKRDVSEGDIRETFDIYTEVKSEGLSVRDMVRDALDSR